MSSKGSKSFQAKQAPGEFPSTTGACHNSSTSQIPAALLLLRYGPGLAILELRFSADVHKGLILHCFVPGMVVYPRTATVYRATTSRR